MTEAFLGFKPGTLSPQPEEDDITWYDGDRTAANYADAEPEVTEF